MNSTDAFITAARAYLNTPHQHQGRIKGVGVDCVGLLVCAANDVGIHLDEGGAYSRRPDGRTLVERIRRNAQEVFEPRSGDVAVFWIRNPRLPTHLGILTDKGLLHSYEGVGKVVETTFDERWKRRVHAYFRINGMED